MLWRSQDPNISQITATISGGGIVNIDAPSLRVDELPARGVWTVRIRLTGLSPWTGYVYSVTQNGTTLNGSFQTLPGDNNTPFAFIVGTCDRYPYREILLIDTPNNSAIGCELIYTNSKHVSHR